MSSRQVPDLGDAEIGRWRAGTEPYTDIRGVTWEPDADVAEGGTVSVSDVVVIDTGNPELYRSQRVGVRSYRLPVPGAGRYLVLFHLAETEGAAAGDRVFDVSVDGTIRASDVDAATWFGPGRAGHVAVFVDTAGGRVVLDLISSAGMPAVSAVSVSPSRLGSTDPVLLWSDEFDGPAGPPGADWISHQGGDGWGNNEQQYYTSRLENAALDGAGNLVVRARREDYTGPDGVRTEFTSARLSTENSFSFTYGRIEARARFPEATGLLPAVWAMGTDLPAVGWPASGEIDVIETPVAATGQVHGTVHGPDGSPRGYSISGGRNPPEDMASVFHTYAVDWYPGVLVFSVDDTPYAVVAEADFALEREWVFDKPYFLLLSLAVGGDWPGEPSTAIGFPQEMVLDHIRVSR